MGNYVHAAKLIQLFSNLKFLDCEIPVYLTNIHLGNINYLSFTPLLIEENKGLNYPYFHKSEGDTLIISRNKLC